MTKNNKTISLELSAPQVEFIASLLNNCQVHSQHAVLLVELKAQLLAEVQKFNKELEAPETDK